MARVLVLKVPLPELKLTVPRIPAPSLKVTVPVGVPAPGETALRVAAKATFWLKTEGLTEETSRVALGDWFTVCVSVALVLVVKLVSPPYTTVIGCMPIARELVEKVPLPELNPAVPRVAAPSLKVTVPVGVPTPGETA